MAQSYAINLTTTLGSTPAILCGGLATKATVDIVADTTSFPWGSAVVDLQWSLNADKDTKWNAFSPAVQFTTSATARRNIAIGAVNHVRLVVSTADGSADPNATVYVRIA